jgi:hypothetical protein
MAGPGWFAALSCVGGAAVTTCNILRYFVEQALAAGVAAAQRLDKTLIALAALDLGGRLILVEKRTKSASASVVRPVLRSSRWTCRESRSSLRAKAASIRSAPSGDIQEVTAASTIAEREMRRRIASSLT